MATTPAAAEACVRRAGFPVRSASGRCGGDRGRAARRRRRQPRSACGTSPIAAGNRSANNWTVRASRSLWPSAASRRLDRRGVQDPTRDTSVAAQTSHRTGLQADHRPAQRAHAADLRRHRTQRRRVLSGSAEPSRPTQPDLRTRKEHLPQPASWPNARATTSAQTGELTLHRSIHRCRFHRAAGAVPPAPGGAVAACRQLILRNSHAAPVLQSRSTRPSQRARGPRTPPSDSEYQGAYGWLARATPSAEGRPDPTARRSASANTKARLFSNWCAPAPEVDTPRPVTHAAVPRTAP